MANNIWSRPATIPTTYVGSTQLPVCQAIEKEEDCRTARTPRRKKAHEQLESQSNVWMYPGTNVKICVGDTVEYLDSHNTALAGIIADLREGYAGNKIIVLKDGASLYPHEVRSFTSASSLVDVAAIQRKELEAKVEEVYVKILESDLLKVPGGEVLLDVVDLLRKMCRTNK